MNDTEVIYDQLVVSLLFDDIVLMVPIAKFSTPKFLNYKGVKDPITYIIHFKMAMVLLCILEEKRDAIFCKIFASTLQEMVRKWFIELSLMIIKNLFELVKIFITNYVYNKPIRKESYHFFIIIQDNCETMESYMRKFKREKMDIS